MNRNQVIVYFFVIITFVKIPNLVRFKDFFALSACIGILVGRFVTREWDPATRRVFTFKTTNRDFPWNCTGNGVLTRVSKHSPRMQPERIRKTRALTQAGFCIAWQTADWKFGRVESWWFTLHRQNAENLKQIFPGKEYQALSPNFHIHVSVSELYIPMIGMPYLLEEIYGPILGIYKSHGLSGWIC